MSIVLETIQIRLIWMTFLFGEGVTVIEWGELLETSLPAGYLKVELLKDGDGREIRLSAVGERAEQLKDSFLTSVGA